MLAIACIITTVISTSGLQAQSAMERELELLKAQHGKSITAAVEPINRRYQEGLKKLIDRATQAKDLETALKIKEALNQSAYEDGEYKPGLNSPKASDPVYRLPTTSWYWGSNRTMKFTFLRDGRFSGHFKGATWRPVSPDLIYYSWGAYSGVMRVTQGFERLDAAEWTGGTAVAPVVVVVMKAE